MQVISFVGQVSDELKRKAKTALEIIGGQAETYAADLCPVKTGNLRSSITHQFVSDYTIEVGTPVKYGIYVELGHPQRPGRYVPAIGKRLVRSFVPGKPFLRPAFENHLDEYKTIFEDVFNS